MEVFGTTTPHLFATGFTANAIAVIATSNQKSCGVSMSKKKIEKALAKKGLEACELYFDRSIPVPECHTFGWEISLTEESEDKLFDNGYEGSCNPDCRNTTEVLEWIETLPNCATL